MAQFGSLSVTAACGGCREHERRQWSKLCEAKSEQTILDTTRGHFDKFSHTVHFQACNLKLKFNIGVWLSLVERLVRDQKVGCSNHLTPTKEKNRYLRLSVFSFYRINSKGDSNTSRRLTTIQLSSLIILPTID